MKKTNRGIIYGGLNMWWYKGFCFLSSIIYREQEPVFLEWCISDWAKRLSKCPFLQIKLLTSDSHTMGDLLCFESTLLVITVFHLISPACLLIKVKPPCENCLSFFRKINRVLLYCATWIQSVKTEIFYFL